MKYAVRRPRQVEEDQLAAALWYDEGEPGLGDAFLDESESTIQKIASHPLLYSVRFADVRCARVRRFKRYGVYYFIQGNEIILVAIHHGFRDPDWLKARHREIS